MTFRFRMDFAIDERPFTDENGMSMARVAYAIEQIATHLYTMPSVPANMVIESADFPGEFLGSGTHGPDIVGTDGRSVGRWSVVNEAVEQAAEMERLQYRQVMK